MAFTKIKDIFPLYLYAFILVVYLTVFLCHFMLSVIPRIYCTSPLIFTDKQPRSIQEANLEDLHGLFIYIPI